MESSTSDRSLCGTDHTLFEEIVEIRMMRISSVQGLCQSVSCYFLLCVMMFVHLIKL